MKTVLALEWSTRKLSVALGEISREMALERFRAPEAMALLNEVLAESGLDSGDIIYVMASFGTDSSLARVEIDAGGNIAETDDIGLAEFLDVGDLSAFTGDNILGFNLVT